MSLTQKFIPLRNPNPFSHHLQHTILKGGREGLSLETRPTVNLLTNQYTGVGLMVVGRVHTVEPLLASCVPEICRGVGIIRYMYMYMYMHLHT